MKLTLFAPGDRPTRSQIREDQVVVGPHSSGTRLVHRMMQECTMERWWHQSWPTGCLLPDPTRIVWVHRDPGITARSQLARGMSPTEAECRYAVYLAWQELNLQIHMTPNVKLILVKYEELLENPDSVMRQLAAWWPHAWNADAFQEKLVDGNIKHVES